MPKDTEVLQSLKDALKFWAIQLSSSDDALRENVPAATVENPLKEVVKIVKLIRAHTTKVGIIYEPSKLESSGDASVTTVSDLSKSFILYISALAQLSPEKTSQIFYDEIKATAHELVNATIIFVEELRLLIENVSSDKVPKPTDSSPVADSTPETDSRLVSVGKIWNLCDDFQKLVEGGSLKVLEKKTRLNLSLIEDGLDEFAEWAENPEEIDDDDPFGLEDEFSDEEDESEDEADDGSKPPVPEPLDEEVLQQMSKDKEDLTAYSKLWLQKFKLVKLLFLSTHKSLPALTSGKNIDQIFQNQTVVAREIDTLIVELMLNHTLDDMVTKHALKVDDACFKIVRLLKDSNKKSEAKVKWCASWEAKYKELSEEMCELS